MYKQSVLIIGTNEEEIRRIIDEILRESGIANLKSPDVLELADPKNIGIELVRQAQVFLTKKPLISKKKIVLIHNAENLSQDAQNALLKTLEEPNTSSQIVLISNTENGVLGTIISRCQKIVIKKEFTADPHLEEIAEKFAKAGVGERLAIIEENKDVFTDRNETVKFLDTLAFTLRKNLTQENAKYIGSVMKVEKDVSSTNVNPRLA